MSLHGDFPRNLYACAVRTLRCKPLRANLACSMYRDGRDVLRQPNVLPLMRVHHARRHFREGQAALRPEVDLDEIAHCQLAGRNQVGKRKYKISLDGPFQMPSSVAQIRAFLQQKILDAWSALEEKVARARG